MHKNDFNSGRWKDWFAFSRRERNGTIVLLVMLLLESLVLAWVHYIPHENAPEDFSEFDRQAAAFISAQQEAKLQATALQAGKDKVPPAELFLFNPNVLADSGWRMLGIPEKTIHTVRNYLSKGGQFRTKDDLKKIYGFSSDDYNRVAPFIALPGESKKKQQETFYHGKNNKPMLTDIGIADTIELRRIRGVGPVFARRIDNYRARLGGFHEVSQLREVYGMTDSLYEAILPQVFIADTTNIRHLRLNNLDFMELKNHPYIGYDLAGLIVNYRKQHGVFHSNEELLKIPLVTDELYRKLAPYLSVE